MKPTDKQILDVLYKHYGFNMDETDSMAVVEALRALFAEQAPARGKPTRFELAAMMLAAYRSNSDRVYRGGTSAEASRDAFQDADALLAYEDDS